MGKRRRSPRDAWWKQQYGGMPVWGLIGGAVLVLTFGVVALLNQPQTATAERGPRPIPTFSYGEERTPAAPPVALFIGDSYTDGAGASTPANRWTTLVANEKGWQETNWGIGGSGYLTSTPERFCTRDDGCPAYPGAIAGAAADGVTPALIIVSGGRNDPGNPENFRAAVTATLNAAAEHFPGVPVYVTSPLGDDDTPITDLQPKIDAARDAAAASGAKFLDIGQPLYGDAANVVEDSIHPSDTGHRLIADAVLNVMLTAP